MTGLKLSERALESMGFKRRDLGEGFYDMVKPVYKGMEIWYSDGIFELASHGQTVPLRCRSKQHLELIIKVL